jgi:hypothetical protein
MGAQLLPTDWERELCRSIHTLDEHTKRQLKSESDRRQPPECRRGGRSLVVPEHEAAQDGVTLLQDLDPVRHSPDLRLIARAEIIRVSWHKDARIGRGCSVATPFPSCSFTAAALVRYA